MPTWIKVQLVEMPVALKAALSNKPWGSHLVQSPEKLHLDSDLEVQKMGHSLGVTWTIKTIQ